MKKRHNNSPKAELRRQAEAKLSKRKKKTAPAPATEADTRRLVHELEVHQIELEMQNEELMQSRAELEAAYRKFTDLYDFAPVGYFTLARDGTIRQVNLAGANLLGLERGKLIKRRLGVFVSVQSRPAFNAFLEKLLAGRGKETCELALLKNGNDPFWVRIEATCFEDGQESRAVMVDITAPKQAEEALARSEREFRNLADNALVGIYRTTLKGEILYVNDALAGMFSFNSAQEMIRDGVVARYKNPADRKAFLQVLQKQGRVSDREIEVLTKTGETRNILLSATREGNEITGMIVDITERKRAEERIRESEDRYRDLVENSQDLICTHDLEGRILSANLTAIRVLGYTADEIINKNLLDFLAPGSEDGFKAYLAVIKKEGMASGLLRVMTRAGELRIWEYNNNLRQSGGAEPVVRGMARDITERWRAEKAQHASEEQFRLLFENAPVGIGVADMQGNLLAFNDAMLKPGDYSREDIQKIGNVASLYYDPVQRDETIALFRKQGYVRDRQIAFKRRDGTPYDVLLSLTPATFQGQDCIQAMVVDITKRKRAEEALRRAEQRYRGLFEDAPAMYVITRNVEGSPVIADCNELFSRTLGFSRDELLGRPLADFYSPSSRAEMLEGGGYWRALAGEFAAEERELQTRDGRIVPCVVRVVPEADAAGHVYGTRAMYVDITERKQAEKALRQAEAKYRNIFENAIEGIFQTTPKGEFTTANPALARMLGYDSPEELIARMKDFNSGFYVQPPRREEFMRQLSDHGMIYNFESEVHRKDGGTIWVSENAQAVRDDLGQVLYYEGTFEDVTERKQAGEALRQRLAELTTIHQTAQRLTELHTPESLSLEVIHILEETLNYEYGAVLLVAEDNDQLMPFILSDQGKGPEFLAQDKDYLERLDFRLGKGITGRVALHGQSVRLGDVSQDVRYLAVRESIRSELCVPLRIGERVIGVVNVETTRPNAYSESDQRVLETIAAQIAIAIQNARLFEQTRQRVAELETLYESGLALNQLLSPKEIGQKIIELLEQKMDWHHTAIRLIHPQDGSLELLAFHLPGLESEAEERAAEERLKKLIFRPGEGFSGWAVQHSQSVRSGDVSNDPRYVESYPGLHSGLYVPMKLGDREIGVISIESERPNAFSEADERLVATLANQAASALENARLFEETRQRVAELETINRTSIALRAVSKQDEMLAIVLEETLAALNAAHGSLNLLNDATGKLYKTIARGWPSEFIESPIQPGEGIFGNVFASGNTYISRDFLNDPLTRPKARGQLPSGWGGACVPIRSTNQTFGVLLVAIPSERELSKDEVRLLNTLAEMTGNALHRMRLHEETERRLENLQALREVDRAISSSFDLHPILNTVINHTIAQLGVDAADVLLLHPALHTLEYAAGYGFHTRGIERTNLRLGEGYAGRAALERRTVHISNLPETGSEFMRISLLAGESFMEYYGVPLITKGEVKGVLEVFHRSAVPSNPEWLGFLETLAGQAAIAIDNSQLFDNLQSSNLELALAYDATIEGWSRAMELRDEETEGHTQRVTETAVKLAKVFGLNDKETLQLRHGALLHDIGKIGVPDHILLKPGKLTGEEWVVMRKHPQFAYEMLLPIKYLHQALEIPYCHHEKWDGTGYPRGLKGEQIPMAARIFAIVDVYDALISDRPYRSAWSKEQALDYIEKQSGKHFDPKVVEAFMSFVSRM